MQVPVRSARLDYDRLVQAVGARKGVELRPGARLEMPEPPQPFVPPKITIQPAGMTVREEVPRSEVLLIGAPAAVGKTTAARHLAATCGIPLLNLAKIRVSTDSLVGLLVQDVRSPSDPVSAVHRGDLAIVVDALDEGRMLSGQEDWEVFLRTTWELFLRERQNPAIPKLAMLGRHNAVDLVEITLLEWGQGIQYAKLELDFFDLNDATRVVLEHASATARQDGTMWRPTRLVRQTVAQFFEAIAGALGLSARDLWRDPQGRAFAGYAPILSALGMLLARKHPRQGELRDALKRQAGQQAWAVVEGVIETILEREQQEKVWPVLRSRLTVSIPGEAYDREEQLTYLSHMAQGTHVQLTGRTRLTGQDLETYRRVVNQHLPEHPFLQRGQLANDVMASVVFAHGIGRGTLESPDGKQLLRASSREPFLWRSMRRLIERETALHLSGENIGFVLHSLWNDEMALVVSVSGRNGLSPESVEITVEEVDGVWTMHARAPVVFYSRIRDLDWQVDAPLLWLGWQSGQVPGAFEIEGDVTIVVPSLEVQADSVRIAGDLRLKADRVQQPPNLRLGLQNGARVWRGGALEDLWPWRDVGQKLGHLQTQPEPTRLEELLKRLAVQFPAGMPIVLPWELTALPEGNRKFDWLRRAHLEEMFLEIVRLLINREWATKRKAQTGQPRPMAIVRFAVSWQQLRDNVTGRRRDPQMRPLVDELEQIQRNYESSRSHSRGTDRT